MSLLTTARGEDCCEKYNAAEIPGLLKRNSTDALADFLKSWKTAELQPLRKLKKQVPWQKFLSSYYRKLRDAVRV